MEFKRGQFKINGKHSEEFNAFITERPVRVSAGRVIELRERAGADSVVMDYQYYKNVEWRIKCYAKAPSLESVSHYEDLIRAWLDMSSYSDFTYYFDEQYVYQAIVTSAPDFTGTKRNGPLIPFEFTISLRPFKQSRTGLRAIKNEHKLFNTEKYPSEPKILIKGSGDISFSINDEIYQLRNVENEIIIDSQLKESYKIENNELIPQDNKTFFAEFPVLNVGKNEILWTGSVAEFSIIPRWGTKV